MFAVRENVEAEFVEEVVFVADVDGLAAFDRIFAQGQGQQALVQGIAVVGVGKLEPFARRHGHAGKGIVAAVPGVHADAVVIYYEPVFALRVGEVGAGDEEGACGAHRELQFHSDDVIVVGGGALGRLADGVELLVAAHDFQAGAFGVNDHAAFRTARPGWIAVFDIAKLHGIEVVKVERGARLVAGLHEVIHHLRLPGARHGHLPEAVGIAEVVVRYVHSVFLGAAALYGVLQDACRFVGLPDG